MSNHLRHPLADDPVFSASVRTAASGPLVPVIEELDRAGYPLLDQGRVFFPNGQTPLTAPQVTWGAYFIDGEEPNATSICINPDMCHWALSVTASEVYFWGGVCGTSETVWALPADAVAEFAEAPLLAVEQGWPGLETAVKRARELAFDHWHKSWQTTAAKD